MVHAQEYHDKWCSLSLYTSGQVADTHGHTWKLSIPTRWSPMPPNRRGNQVTSRRGHPGPGAMARVESGPQPHRKLVDSDEAEGQWTESNIREEPDWSYQEDLGNGDNSCLLWETCQIYAHKDQGSSGGQRSTYKVLNNLKLLVSDNWEHSYSLLANTSEIFQITDVILYKRCWFIKWSNTFGHDCMYFIYVCCTSMVYISVCCIYT